MTEQSEIQSESGTHDPERSIGEQVFILFVQTSRVVNKYYNTYLNKKLGLSISKIATLTVLDASGGVMNPSEIADRIHTERNNITTLIARMSKEGLVKTERDPQDKRLVNVSMTEKGKRVFNEAKPVIREAIQRMLVAMSEDNAWLLERPLRILRQNARDGLDELLES
ncbi:MAG: MarR family transcriptional regulator [Dehalococcoidales bacterium]|nr:MarR family transcriptional regulator [Dehalococcoidales bacterium]